MKKSLYIICFFTFLNMSLCMGFDVEITSLKITPTDDYYFVEGTVTASGLNDDGIPEWENIDVIAEFKNGANSKYPVPYEWLGYYPPQGKTSYVIGSRYLSEEEVYGKNINSLSIASFHIRKSPVWKEYGENWKINAPNTVIKKFNGTIPKKYAGKEGRIHVILSQVTGGPFASWPSKRFAHAVKPITLKKENSISKIEAINKLNEIFRNAGKNRNIKSKIGNLNFKKPTDKNIIIQGTIINTEKKRQIEHVKNKLNNIANKNNNIEIIRIKTPYGEDIKIVGKDISNYKNNKKTSQYFKYKYYANKYIGDGLIGVILDKFSLGGLAKNWVISNKDSIVYDNNEQILKTSKELHVDKTTAKLYNEMNGIDQMEKNYPL